MWNKQRLLLWIFMDFHTIILKIVGSSHHLTLVCDNDWCRVLKHVSKSYDIFLCCHKKITSFTWNDLCCRLIINMPHTTKLCYLNRSLEVLNTDFSSSNQTTFWRFAQGRGKDDFRNNYLKNNNSLKKQTNQQQQQKTW